MSAIWSWASRSCYSKKMSMYLTLIAGKCLVARLSLDRRQGSDSLRCCDFVLASRRILRQHQQQKGGALPICCACTAVHWGNMQYTPIAVLSATSMFCLCSAASWLYVLWLVPAALPAHKQGSLCLAALPTHAARSWGDEGLRQREGTVVLRWHFAATAHLAALVCCYLR